MKDATRIVGVDLGQQRDWTAICVIERGYVLGDGRQPGRLEYHLRHLERPALGTSYPDVVERIVGLVKELGGELDVVVDATGVGLPVTDMLWRRLRDEIETTPGLTVNRANVTITGGDSVTRVPGGYRVPKRDLISAPLVLMQHGQLKIAKDLALKDVLVRELLHFRVKITIATAHDSYETWREGDHDDLVLAVALACWAGERFLKRLAKVYSF